MVKPSFLHGDRRAVQRAETMVTALDVQLERQRMQGVDNKHTDWGVEEQFQMNLTVEKEGKLLKDYILDLRTDKKPDAKRACRRKGNSQDCLEGSRMSAGAAMLYRLTRRSR
jgi:hypothetical protein